MFTLRWDKTVKTVTKERRNKKLLFIYKENAINRIGIHK